MKLEGILKPNQVEAGFYLEEENDHILLLRRSSETVATFNQGFVTRELVVAAADAMLVVEKGR